MPDGFRNSSNYTFIGGHDFEPPVGQIGNLITRGGVPLTLPLTGNGSDVAPNTDTASAIDNDIDTFFITSPYLVIHI